MNKLLILVNVLHSPEKAMQRLILLFALLVLTSCQNALLFHPDVDMRGWDASPLRQHPRLQELHFQAADGIKLHGLLIRPSSGPSDRLILHCHGNGGNLTHRIQWAADLADGAGASVLLFDYRGYGHSEGSPDEKGVCLDAVAAYDHALQLGYRPENLVINGSSLGGAVALALAEKRPSVGLVLEASFTSIPDMAEIYYPWIPRWAMNIDFNSLERIRRWQGPLLVIHGSVDELIPVEMGRQLYQACPSTEKSFLLIEGGNHSAPCDANPALFLREFRNFVQSPSRQPQCLTPPQAK